MDLTIITLTGNPKNLQKNKTRIQQDKDLDILNIYPESLIVPSDLIFTLKHNPSEYFRPAIRYEQEGLCVVSNIPFYRAGIEAGLDEMLFDLVLDKDVPLEELKQHYNLKSLDSEVIQREYFERFLFFKRTQKQPNQLGINPLIRLSPLNNTSEFQQNNCLAYKFLIDKPKKDKQIDQEFVASLFNINGYLRSINGIRCKTHYLGKYIH